MRIYSSFKYKLEFIMLGIEDEKLFSINFGYNFRSNAPTDFEKRILAVIDNSVKDCYDIQLQLGGTDFQKTVWEEIRKIPYGETITYKELAVKIGKPKAYRAVANACAANKIPIIVPCHRVIGSNNIGGYSLGLDFKKMLLKREKENK